MNTTPTVLLADDEVSIRILMEKLLQRERCEVVALASDGQEALDLYHRHQPDITILDINMPKLSGVDVLRKIRKLHTDSYVFMYSGDVNVDVVREIAKLGISGYMVKPIRQEKVQSVIHQYHLQQLSPKVRGHSSDTPPTYPSTYAYDNNAH